MKPTNINDPEYFHKVVDCQYACPAHTPVPEYIRLIAEGKYTEAYMINWDSNVFPGILGRTCDRPCEPACRRGRIDEEPVAICRLKRVAADNKDEVKHLMPQAPFKPNGKKVARGEKKAVETLCTMCHLRAFMGQNEIPRVASQHYEYIVKQMRDFKTGKRTNDAGNMASVSKTLSDQDIDDLGHYLAGLY